MDKEIMLPSFTPLLFPPMETLSIEFHANEPGIWFLHCHNLYHMKMGMSRLVKYQGFQLPEELKNDHIERGKEMTKDNDAFWKGGLGLYSNMAKVKLDANAGRYEVELKLEIDQYELNNLEVEGIFKKYLHRFFALGGGALIEDKKAYAALVTAYTLPGNIKMEGYLRHDGKAMVKLNKHIPLITIKNRLLVLDLEPKLSYKDQLKWGFKLGLDYRYSKRVFFRFNLKTRKNNKSMGAGIKIKFLTS